MGAVGAVLANCSVPLLDKLRIDDPVGAIAVHGAGSVWGMLAVGLFVEADELMRLSKGLTGLFRGGGWRLLGVQLMAVVVVTAWSMITTFVLLYVRISDWNGFSLLYLMVPSRVVFDKSF